MLCFNPSPDNLLSPVLFIILFFNENSTLLVVTETSLNNSEVLCLMRANPDDTCQELAQSYPHDQSVKADSQAENNHDTKAGHALHHPRQYQLHRLHPHLRGSHQEVH